MLQTAKIALPFLDRLIIEGSSVIGEDAIFSGPVVGQYLVTVLNAINLDSTDSANKRINILTSTLDGLTRPVIIGDEDQNVMVTEDGYYIENFTYADGKYKIIMVVSLKGDQSSYPMMRGKTIDTLTKVYFQ